MNVDRRCTPGVLMIALHVILARLPVLAQQPPTSPVDSTPKHLTGNRVIRFPDRPGAVEYERYLLQGTRINGGCSFRDSMGPQRVFPPDTSTVRRANSAWVVEYDVDNCLQIRARGYAPVPPMMSTGGHSLISSFALAMPTPQRDSATVAGAAKTIRRLSVRERAMIAAVLYVRGTAAEDLRSAPADSIVVDLSSMLAEERVMSTMDASAGSVPEALAQLLRAHITWQSNPSCGGGLPPNEALIARGQCAIARSKYYIEPEAQTIADDSALVLVHVFHQPLRIQRVGYAKYLILLQRGVDGWEAPRLISIREM